jgi:hypothetical protein
MKPEVIAGVEAGRTVPKSVRDRGAHPSAAVLPVPLGDTVQHLLPIGGALLLNGRVLRLHPLVDRLRMGDGLCIRRVLKTELTAKRIECRMPGAVLKILEIILAEVVGDGCRCLTGSDRELVLNCR